VLTAIPGVGAYRDDQGKPYVLPSVRTAEDKVIAAKLNKEYAGITGVPEFTKAAALLAYGPGSSALDRVVITQSISGTGALRIGGAFLSRHFPFKGEAQIYIPTPSWANHKAVFSDCGLKVNQYSYYNKDTIGLDFDGMVADMKKAPAGSVFLLHACAHNPTGVDPTIEQWKEISKVMKEAGHYAFFDMAYQGFASGDTNKDAFPIRQFIEDGHNICLAQSFAKNMASQKMEQFCNYLTLYRVCMVSVSELSPLFAPMQMRRSAWIRKLRFSSDLCTPTLQFMVPALPLKSSTTQRSMSNGWVRLRVWLIVSSQCGRC
jgi:aspartate/tyrosine/aromatic aminotransferase